MHASSPSYFRFHLAVLALVMAIGGGALAILWLANQQFNQAAQEWQARLSLISDSRTSEVQQWLATRADTLSALAENASLQLYMTEINQAADSESPYQTDDSQRTYLRHMLTLAAASHFSAPATPHAIPANVPRNGTAGVALLDATGKVMAATPDMPAITGALATFVTSTPKGQHGFLDIEASNNTATPHVAFLVPVYAIQGSRDASSQIGAVLGVAPVSESLFSLLPHPGTTERTLRSQLLRLQGERVETISPTAEHAPLAFSTPFQPQKTAESAAVNAAGSAGWMHAADGSDVLFASRAVSLAPWVLITRIDASEALASAIAARQRLLVILSLAFCAVLLAILAAWRYGISRNTLRQSRLLTRVLRESRLSEAVLKLVTNTHPGAIFLLDTQHHLHYANTEAAAHFAMDMQDIIGKRLENVVGVAKAETFTLCAQEALDGHHSVLRTSRDDSSVIRWHHIPVDDIAFESTPKAGVLIIEEDITTVVHERERRERILAQLTDSLVRMVDSRDPLAAEHSLKVAALARAVAEAMHLSPEMAETAETAGKLLNIGKMHVPSEMLTRKDALKTGERDAIRHSLHASADMIRDVEFDGPVVETLQQAAEHYDGSGPLGLKGEAILASSRVVAVANAFIGMTSPRAYRGALPTQKAVDTLMQGIDKEFDRKVVLALANYVENATQET